MAYDKMKVDPGKMHAAADDIRKKVQNYRKAHNEVTTTVKGMGAYWEDSVNQNFVRKYNAELDELATGIDKLMEAYATFLDDSATAYEKAIASGNAKLNG